MDIEVKINIRPLWKRYLLLPKVAYAIWLNNKGRGIRTNFALFVITAKCITKRYKSHK